MFNKILFNKTPFNRLVIVLGDGSIIELEGQFDYICSLTGNRILIYNLYGSKVQVMLEGVLGTL